MTAVTEGLSFFSSEEGFPASFLKIVSHMESMACNAGKIVFDIKRQIFGNGHGRAAADNMRVLQVFPVMA